MLCFLLRLCHIRCQFFILIIFFASSKRQVILLHIILPQSSSQAAVEDLSFVVPERVLISNSKPISWHPGERNRLLVVKKADQAITKMQARNEKLNTFVKEYSNWREFF